MKKRLHYPLMQRCHSSGRVMTIIKVLLQKSYKIRLLCNKASWTFSKDIVHSYYDLYTHLFYVRTGCFMGTLKNWIFNLQAFFSGNGYQKVSYTYLDINLNPVQFEMISQIEQDFTALDTLHP